MKAEDWQSLGAKAKVPAHIAGMGSGLVYIIAMAAGAVPFSMAAMTPAVVAVLYGLVGIVMTVTGRNRDRWSIRLQANGSTKDSGIEQPMRILNPRPPRCVDDKRRGYITVMTLISILVSALIALALQAGCNTLAGRTLPSAGACAAACSVRCFESDDAGRCALGCAVGCASSWVAGLLEPGGGTLSASAEVAGRPVEGLPGSGDELVMPVAGADGSTVLLRGLLVGVPMAAGSGYAAWFEHAGGSFLALLCLKLTPYCASTPSVGGELPTGLGPPPQSLEGFGELPSFTP